MTFVSSTTILCRRHCAGDHCPTLTTATWIPLIERLERTAQTWEQLIFYSGGALNLSKCSWSISYWTWIHGIAHDTRTTTSTESDWERSETTNSVCVHRHKHKLCVCVCVDFWFGNHRHANQHNRPITAENSHLIKEIAKHMFFAKPLAQPLRWMSR
jgi:hypothetical protein